MTSALAYARGLNQGGHQEVSRTYGSISGSGWHTMTTVEQFDGDVDTLDEVYTIGMKHSARALTTNTLYSPVPLDAGTPTGAAVYPGMRLIEITNVERRPGRTGANGVVGVISMVTLSWRGFLFGPGDGGTNDPGVATRTPSVAYGEFVKDRLWPKNEDNTSSFTNVPGKSSGVGDVYTREYLPSAIITRWLATPETTRAYNATGGVGIPSAVDALLLPKPYPVTPYAWASINVTVYSWPNGWIPLGDRRTEPAAPGVTDLWQEQSTWIYQYPLSVQDG